MNPSEHIPLILSILVLLLFSAFFSGSETAFFSLSTSSVAEMEKGGRRRRSVAALLREPRMLLVTVLFGNLLVNIASTSAVTALAIGIFGEKGVGVAVLVMTLLILVFGEITPKSLAMKYATVFAVTTVPILSVVMVLFTPFRIVLGAIADFAVERSRELFGERREEYGARELATAVEIGHREGLFDEFENEVLTNLFLFTEKTVREVLVPRVEVFSIDIETPLNDAIAQVRSHGFSRVPLYEETKENIVGILLARDLLFYSRGEKVALRDFMRQTRFVPESKLIRDLFGELIAAHQKIVMAVDEHGSFTGILTFEDILEEIFGEIRDRLEPKVEDYLIIDEDHVVAEGAMKLEDINDVFDTDLKSDEAETIAGYLIEEIGRIPREGESIRLSGLRFLVLSAEPTRVNKIKIERIKTVRMENEPS